MAKSLGLRKFFAQAKKRVPIKVGNRLMEFTATQAVRLSDLADTRKEALAAQEKSVVDTGALSLEEAAVHLLVSEDELLAAAANGRREIYVDITGHRGRWMSKSESLGVQQSSVHKAERGYLALMQKDVATLADNGRVAVNMLTLVQSADSKALNLPRAVVGALAEWGQARKHFRLETPLTITRDAVFLLPPLAANEDIERESI